MNQDDIDKIVSYANDLLVKSAHYDVYIKKQHIVLHGEKITPLTFCIKINKKETQLEDVMNFLRASINTETPENLIIIRQLFEVYDDSDEFDLVSISARYCYSI